MATRRLTGVTDLLQRAARLERTRPVAPVTPERWEAVLGSPQRIRAVLAMLEDAGWLEADFPSAPGTPLDTLRRAIARQALGADFVQWEADDAVAQATRERQERQEATDGALDGHGD